MAVLPQQQQQSSSVVGSPCCHTARLHVGGQGPLCAMSAVAQCCYYGYGFQNVGISSACGESAPAVLVLKSACRRSMSLRHVWCVGTCDPCVMSLDDQRCIGLCTKSMPPRVDGWLPTRRMDWGPWSFLVILDVVVTDSLSRVLYGTNTTRHNSVCCSCCSC